jgi:gas vesicle protein
VGKTGNRFAYLVGGACVGVGLGILFAPKGSSESRDYARRKARELRERADELIERSKDVARGKSSGCARFDDGTKKVESESESI